MSKAPAFAATMPPARVLCLHGYCQNGAVFRAKTGALRKSLAKSGTAELVYIDAPFTVSTARSASTAPGDTSSNASPSGTPLTWWKASADGAVYSGYERSLHDIRAAFLTQGPFVGILGFSQGAVLAAVIAAQATDPAFASLRFAILVSGMPSRAEEHAPLFAEPVALPSLHVIGEADKLVPPEASRKLHDLFHDPILFQHSAGHLVPSTAPAREMIAAFITSTLRPAASL